MRVEACRDKAAHRRSDQEDEAPGAQLESADFLHAVKQQARERRADSEQREQIRVDDQDLDLLLPNSLPLFVFVAPIIARSKARLGNLVLIEEERSPVNGHAVHDADRIPANRRRTVRRYPAVRFVVYEACVWGSQTTGFHVTRVVRFWCIITETSWLYR